MIQYRHTIATEDLQGILVLQADNLRHTKSLEIEQSQGFVTVKHQLEQLRKMHDLAPHIIAEDDGKIVAYAIAMDRVFGNDIPELIAMFDMLNGLEYNSKSVKDINYVVMGQVCVHEDHRGQGVFEALYAKYFDFYKDKYNYVITEIAERNTRSLRAHSKVGFETIHKYHEEGMEDWIVVIRKI